MIKKHEDHLIVVLEVELSRGKRSETKFLAVYNLHPTQVIIENQSIESKKK